MDVAITVHFCESMLACLATVAWHFFPVILDPDVYPLTTVCLDGRVSEVWHTHGPPHESVSPNYAKDEKDAENTPWRLENDPAQPRPNLITPASDSP